LQQVEVDFAERRGLMHNARTGIDGDEIGSDNSPSKMLLASFLQSSARIAKFFAFVAKFAMVVVETEGRQIA
jgi:hypothetical protein